MRGLTKYQKIDRKERRKNKSESEGRIYITPKGIKRVEMLHPTKGFRDRNFNLVSINHGNNLFWKLAANFTAFV